MKLTADKKFDFNVDSHKKPLVIGGKTLLQIENTDSLEQYFDILLKFADSIIGYDLLPY